MSTPNAAADPRLHFQYGSDELLRQIDREGSTPLNQTSMTWDADEQRLQLRDVPTEATWSFLSDAAAGIPAVLVVKHIDDKEDEYLTVYVREPGGELLASFEPGAGTTYYHFDALGSTVLLSDASGNPNGAYAYGAWGDVLAAPGAWQPYQYVGQLGYYTHTPSQGSEISDWLQLGVRFYDPDLGRFERRDPIVAQGATPYKYAEGRPTTAVDPQGLWSLRPTPWPPDFIDIPSMINPLPKEGRDYANKCKECIDCYYRERQNGDDKLEAWRVWCGKNGIPFPRTEEIDWGALGGHGWHNAVAHCNSTCEIGRNCPSCSRDIAQGRELAGIGGIDKPSEMDRHNNNEGFGCADWSSNSCLRCCLNKLYQGKLKALK